MLIEQDLYLLNHRRRIFGTTIYPRHLVCYGVKRACHGYNASIRLVLRNGIGLGLSNKGTTTIPLDPEWTQFVNKEEKLTWLQSLQGV